MNKVRVYFLITFSETDTIIDFFSLIEEKFGKYDFFSQDIKFNFETANPLQNVSRYKIRIVSIKKLYSLTQMKSLLNKTLKIKEKLSAKGHGNFNIICGYVSTEQVVSLYQKSAPLHMYMGKNTYGQIQFALIDGKMLSFHLSGQNRGEEFALSDVKKYFLDLQRLFKEQVRG